MSASCAGFVSATLTNPIWFVKTRLQLDYNSNGKMTVSECVKRIYATKGIRGFYKGITASYFGISETVIHFVIYEALKKKLTELRHVHSTDNKTSRDFLEFMAAGATSKTIASIVAYPHEVARTRLREEGNKYRSFWQTILTVWKEEGKAGLYRGLGTQLVRQIPNTAIMMATYEAVVYVLSNQVNPVEFIIGNWEQEFCRLAAEEATAAVQQVNNEGGGRCFPALAALLFRENVGNSNSGDGGAVGECVEAAGGALDFLKLEQPAFVVHCICDFYVDL